MGKGKKLGRCLFYAVHNAKEGLLNPVFWIAVILNTFVIYITQETDTSSASSSIDLLEGLQSAFQLGMASYYVPICVSLPGVMGFFDEKASGAYRYKLLRNDRLIYVLKQVGKSMFSGAMVMFFSFLFYTLIMLLLSLKNGVPAVFIAGFYGEEGETNIYICGYWQREEVCLFILCNEAGLCFLP